MPKNKIADTIDPAMGPIDGVGLKIGWDTNKIGTPIAGQKTTHVQDFFK